ncbi:MAG: phospholipase D-like domain-containing protein, partial [Rhizobiaceae bacterium]
MYWLAVFIHVSVALIASAHVLLHKEDVRAAVGWTGLIWLSPALGVCLYFAFGINRVQRSASRIVRSRSRTHDSPDYNTMLPKIASGSLSRLSTLAETVSGNPVVCGNSVLPLIDGEQGYPQMLAAINGASHSIALSAYIFRADRIGSEFVDALVDARNRNADVRVQIDSIGSGMFSLPVADQLKAAGIPVIRFMRDTHPWRLSLLNLRNHKKLLIVDGQIAFLGGLNYADGNGYLGELETRDLHFRIEGPVVSQLMNGFVKDMPSSSCFAQSNPAWWPELVETGTVDGRCVASGPHDDDETIETIFGAAISEARQKIRIVTPYFLPDRTISNHLRLAALKGIEITIIVPGRCDHRWLDWAMRAQMRFSKSDKLNFHLSRAPFDHSKLLTIDGNWCAFGSPNWDVRSMRLNFELLFECYDETTTRKLDTLI